MNIRSYEEGVALFSSPSKQLITETDWSKFYSLPPNLLPSRTETPSAEAKMSSLEDEICRLKLEHEREIAHLKIDRDNWERWCKEAQQVLATIRGLASKIEEAAADALS